jgi:hypothetical protein
MPHSEVPRIELNQDDTISLYVSVYGFDAGTPVEIFGQATQGDGVIASFYDVQMMPASSGKGAILTVKSVPPVPPKKFVESEPIIVVARAAEAWITTLERDAAAQASQAAALTTGSSGFKAIWKSTGYSYAVWPSGWPPPG